MKTKDAILYPHTHTHTHTHTHMDSVGASSLGLTDAEQVLARSVFGASLGSCAHVVIGLGELLLSVVTCSPAISEASSGEYGSLQTTHEERRPSARAALSCRGAVGATRACSMARVLY